MATSYETLVLSYTSLINYWMLNDASGTTAVDSKGSNNLTYTSTGGTGFVLAQTGIPNGDFSVKFQQGSGNSGYASSGTTITMGTGAGTFEIWIYITQLPDGARGGPNPLLLALPTSPVVSMDTTAHPRIQSLDGGGNQIVLSGTACTLNTWHHIVGTSKSGDKVELYLDAVSKGTTALGTWYNTTHGIAPNVAGGSGFFNYLDGYAAHAAIYNAVLTPTEITNNYNTGITAPVVGGPVPAAILPAM